MRLPFRLGTIYHNKENDRCLDDKPYSDDDEEDDLSFSFKQCIHFVYVIRMKFLYALLLVLIAVVSLTVLETVGKQVSGVFARISTALVSVN